MLCMALVHELASGETRQGIGRVLEIAGLDAAKIEAEIALLKSALREQSNVEGTFVNSLWVELENALTALGMERPFDRDRAEFGEIQTDLQPVWIDQVIHRAVAEVDEAGTEAAAVTTTSIMCGSAGNRKPERLFTMVMNRVLFLTICDDKTRSILFLGWIGDPQ
jgi:serine protease inhibitor